MSQPEGSGVNLLSAVRAMPNTRLVVPEPGLTENPSFTERLCVGQRNSAR